MWPALAPVEAVAQVSDMDFLSMDLVRRLHSDSVSKSVTATLASAVETSLTELRSLSDILDRYSYLASLRNTRPDLFFALLQARPEQLLPVVYTPGVGDACLNWGRLKTQGKGLVLSLRNAGQFAAAMRAWPDKDVRLIVVTDGNRILGLGDLGANGMGISFGKAALYTAFGGLRPSQVLPVVLDVGTNNAELRASDAYSGLQEARLDGAAYDDLVAGFFASAQEVYGENVVVHWEDFGNEHAFTLLTRYQKQGPSFNDDIQSTAAVTLAAVLGACRIPNVPRLEEQVFLLVGAGQASLGIAELLLKALDKQSGRASAEDAEFVQGLSREQALERIWLTDTNGVIVEGRPGPISSRKAPYAQKAQVARAAGLPKDTSKTPLEDVIRCVRPTCLIGAAGKRGLFTQQALQTLASGMPGTDCSAAPNLYRTVQYDQRGRSDQPPASCPARPIVFALSNPTSVSECTFQEAFDFTDGRAVFASGSQFPRIELPNGDFVLASQANNSMIFPGVGAGAVFAGSREITDDFFVDAAYALANELTQDELDDGLVTPRTSRIADAAAAVSTAVVINSSVNMLSTSRADALLSEAVAKVLGAAGGPQMDEDGRSERTRFALVRNLIESLRYRPA